MSSGTLEGRADPLEALFGQFLTETIADHIVKRLTELKIYAMRMGDKKMELANAKELAL